MPWVVGCRNRGVVLAGFPASSATKSNAWMVSDDVDLEDLGNGEQ